MNILAIDYGTKRIGLAWVDTALGVVLPFGVAEKGNKKKEIGELIERESIDKIVIGLPIGLDGKENENTKRVRAFGEELKNMIGKRGEEKETGKKKKGIGIEFVDERFSTHEAARTEGGVSQNEKAAMIILETYLETI